MLVTLVLQGQIKFRISAKIGRENNKRVQLLGWAVPGLAGYLGHGDLALQQVEAKGQDTTVSLELPLGLGEDERQNLGTENN